MTVDTWRGLLADHRLWGRGQWAAWIALLAVFSTAVVITGRFLPDLHPVSIMGMIYLVTAALRAGQAFRFPDRRPADWIMPAVLVGFGLALLLAALTMRG